MRDVAADVSRWLRDGERVAVATVVETWGSSPRPLGSHMAVSASGAMTGSVSNGCIEGAVYEQAQEVLAGGAPRLLEYGVADEVAFEAGLACGGHIAVYVQPLEGARRRAVELAEAARPALLRTDLRTGEATLEEGPPPFLVPRREGDLLLEPLPRPAELVIIGAIHIAMPLHRLARDAGYRVTVIDARELFATRDRFPEADEIVVSWPDEALAGREIDSSTAIVILTHDAQFDLPALRTALRSGAGYIGAIGSRGTNANRLAELRSEGFAEADLARIRGPIGLDLGGRGAEEVALGILAEVTAVRFGGSAQPLSFTR